MGSNLLGMAKCNWFLHSCIPFARMARKEKLLHHPHFLKGKLEQILRWNPSFYPILIYTELNLFLSPSVQLIVNSGDLFPDQHRQPDSANHGEWDLNPGVHIMLWYVSHLQMLSSLWFSWLRFKRKAKFVPTATPRLFSFSSTTWRIGTLVLTTLQNHIFLIMFTSFQMGPTRANMSFELSF